MSNFKFHCADCTTKDDCKAAFGRYWNDKSHGGIGCNLLFAYVSLRDIVTGNLPPPKKGTKARVEQFEFTTTQAKGKQ